MKLEEAFKVFEKVQLAMGGLKESSWGSEDFVQEFDYDLEDVEERYKNDVAINIMNQLGKIDNLLEWIQKDVKEEGKLVKRSDGRYEIEGTDEYFSSGKPLEVFLNSNEFNERDEWVKSRVEHANGDYYIVALGKEKSLEGVKVRVR